jgi:Ser/Thr protein kinase RdoA (MazF antagonist)
MEHDDPIRDPATRRFFGLAPERILDAVERAGMVPTGRFQQLNSLENRVFSVEVESAAQTIPPLAQAEASSRVVVKIYRPGRWSQEQIQAEHRFLADLGESGFPAAIPLNLPGEPAVTQGAASTLGCYDGMFYAMWPTLPGRIPDEFSDGMLRCFGRRLARLHEIGERVAAPERAVLDAESLVRRPLSYLERSGLVHPQVWGRYHRAASAVAEALERCLSGMPRHRIHGDCHWGNLLVYGSELSFLDFDDFMTGPAVQDLWMIAPAQDAEGIRQRSVVLSAYRELRHFDEAWLAAVNPLKAGRYIHYSAWIARRWADPAFPAAFPQFGDLEYWETETRDLEQLIERGFDQVFAEEQGFVETEDYSKLTNKDYFWDMED